MFPLLGLFAQSLIGQSGLANMFPLFSMFLIFAVLYFMILRPQWKQQKEREAMIKTVGKGNRVLTSSGIYGTVISVKNDDILVVRIADNVRVEMTRQAISAVLGSETHE